MIDKHFHPDDSANFQIPSNNLTHKDQKQVMREIAEERIQSSENLLKKALSQEETRHILHELQVHQIELEMQNEEMRRIQTELEESRAKYFDLYDLAPVGYVTLNNKGTILEANLTAADLLGVARSSLINKQLSSFIIPEDQDIYYHHCTGLNNACLKKSCEIRMVRVNTAPFWAQVESTSSHQPVGTAVIRTVITDISNAKQTEKNNIEMQQKLLHTQKLESIGILAGGIAHDFNNLLTAILGNIELSLEDISTSSITRNCLEDAFKASKRAAQLTSEMLAYAGKGKFIITDMNLSELVKDNFHIFRTAIPKTITLNLNLTHNIPSITADASQVQQVIMNLITNAAEAIVDAHGIINITTNVKSCDEEYLKWSLIDEKPAPGEFIFLEVSDTGCGMDVETKRQLFDPFFTTKFTGRGLGMAAVMGIVRGHNGAVMVDSVVNQGTTIRILFPVSKFAQDLLAQTDLAEKNTAARLVPLSSGETILIVDDEEAVRKLCSTMVTRLNYTAITAEDGQKAIQIFQDHAEEITCVILDLTMPKMDGHAAFKAMKKINPQVKIILSSGYNELEAIQRFEGLGLAGFIQKPYQHADLRNELIRVLKKNA